MIKSKLPRHIAIIMDGNGRWAKRRFLPRTAGHRQGISRIKEIVKAANKIGIEFLTIFAFSNENWSRPKREVSMLMRALDIFITKELNNLHKDGIRIKVIGRKDPIPKFLQKRIKAAEDLTKNNKRLTFVVALNYGARQEIIDAINNFTKLVVKNEVGINELTEESFSNFLYTKEIPDPDLLIRTSGEMRISNFLLWQLSYTEILFLEKYWPDFRKQDLEEAISEYQRRDRRFGRI